MLSTVEDASLLGRSAFFESALTTVSGFSTKSLFAEFLLKKNQAPTPIAKTSNIKPSLLLPFLGSLLFGLFSPPATSVLDKLNFPLELELADGSAFDKLNAIIVNLKFFNN